MKHIWWKYKWVFGHRQVIDDGQVYPNGYHKTKIKLSILKNIMLDIICFSKHPPFMEEKWQAIKCPSLTLQKSYQDFTFNVKPQHEGVPKIRSIGQDNSQFQPYIWECLQPLHFTQCKTKPM